MYLEKGERRKEEGGRGIGGKTAKSKKERVLG